MPALPDSVPKPASSMRRLRLNVAPVPARFTALPDARLPPAPSASVLPLLIVVPPGRLCSPPSASAYRWLANVTLVPPITPPNVLLVLLFNVSAFAPRFHARAADTAQRAEYLRPDAPLRLNVAPVPAVACSRRYRREGCRPRPTRACCRRRSSCRPYRYSRPSASVPVPANVTPRCRRSHHRTCWRCRSTSARSRRGSRSCWPRHSTHRIVCVPGCAAGLNVAPAPARFTAPPDAARPQRQRAAAAMMVVPPV